MNGYCIQMYQHFQGKGYKNTHAVVHFPFLTIHRHLLYLGFPPYSANFYVFAMSFLFIFLLNIFSKEFHVISMYFDVYFNVYR